MAVGIESLLVLFGLSLGVCGVSTGADVTLGLATDGALTGWFGLADLRRAGDTGGGINWLGLFELADLTRAGDLGGGINWFRLLGLADLSRAGDTCGGIN